MHWRNYTPKEPPVPRSAAGESLDEVRLREEEEEEALGARRDEDIVGHVEGLRDEFLRDLCGRVRERNARELVDVVVARERVVVCKGELRFFETRTRFDLTNS
ncbi:hypothetical protein B9Z19DRAFT_1190906 [Tuber borchii]|uniref:Uncharacterized protein n=1 Tax=Tuber borchii TaxID=42251 RepID=A0A2T7A1V4_TUBBO|nr:hypothetical protein B9Z19DRAFT_1190906 [Tuber borchii]